MAISEVEAKKAVPFCRPFITCVSMIRFSRLTDSMIQRSRRSFISVLRLRLEWGPISTASR